MFGLKSKISCLSLSLSRSRGGRKTESSARIGGGVVSISSELSVGSSEEGLDGCGYIMAATTVFLRLIEVVGCGKNFSSEKIHLSVYSVVVFHTTMDASE